MKKSYSVLLAEKLKEVLMDTVLRIVHSIKIINHSFVHHPQSGIISSKIEKQSSSRPLSSILHL